MKLAFKLGLFLVLGTWLVLALEFWISARRELSFHEANTRQDEQVMGQALGAAIAELWRAEGRASALALVDRANQASGETQVRWIDLDAASGGRVAPGLSPSTLEAVAQGRVVQNTLKPSDEPPRIVTVLPVRVNGGIAGALELSESLAEPHRHVQAALVRRITTAAVLGGLSGLIAMLLGAWVVGGPIGDLVDKTRRIGAGDLSQPLDLHQRDEIGELAREIDAMCERLAEARERIAAETEARIAALEQLRHADRLATVGQLASGVAHELGTPLNVASQRAKMIADGEVTGTDASDEARIIAEQTERMTTVIRQLLDFARRRTPQQGAHDLRRRGAADGRAPGATRATARGHRCASRRATPRVTAEVDSEQLQQALTNLVVNGIQAMPDGGDLRISVGTQVATRPRTRRRRRRVRVRSPCRTRDRASRPSTCRTSSSRSSRPRTSARAPGSDSRSPTASCASTAGGSRSRAVPGRGAASRSTFPATSSPRPLQSDPSRARHRAWNGSDRGGASSEWRRSGGACMNGRV